MKKHQVRARLMEKGLSYRQWARERGYEPRMVTQVISRYAGATELPRGRLSYQILRELSQTIGKEIAPGVLRAEERA